MKRALRPRAAVLATLAVAIAVGAVGAGCGAQHPGTALPGRALLRNVPADTPYFFATLEPSPRDQIDRTLADQRPHLQAIRQRLAEHPAPAPAQRFATVLLDAIEPNLSADGFDRLGIGADTTIAFYGVGLLPVFRQEVKDGHAVDGLIGRLVEAAGGPKPLTGPHGRRWELALDRRATLVVAVTEKELLATVAVTKDLAHSLDVLYGDARVGPSLADSTRVDELLATYKMSPRVVGWLDLAALATAFHTDDSLVQAQLLALGGHSHRATAACKSEGNALVAHMPRLVFGAEEMTLTRQRALGVVELDPELAQDILGLQVSAVGVGAPLGAGILSMGAAVDVPKLLEVVKKRTRRALSAPYTCEHLLGLNEIAGKLDELLAQPLPPWVNDLRGFAFELLDVQTAGGLGMPKIRGAAVLSAVDPIRLIDLAKRFLPQLPAVSIPPDGKPVKLQGGLFFVDVWVAMRGQLLGAAIGDHGDAELVRLMSERPFPGRPLGAMAGDLERLTRFVNDMHKLSGSGETEPPPAVRGTVSVTVTPTARGLAFEIVHEEPR